MVKSTTDKFFTFVDNIFFLNILMVSAACGHGGGMFICDVYLK